MRSIEQLQEKVGYELGVSDWFTIDQGRINAFADVTLDHQFIHIDEERARQTPLGTTIAHGFLTLSLIPHLMKEIDFAPRDVQMAFNYGLDKLRYVNPVASGKNVRVRATLIDIAQKKPGHYLFRIGVVVEIEDSEKPALVAEQLTMFVVSQ